MASFPTTVVNFGVDRIDGDYIPATDTDDMRHEIVAIETALRAPYPAVVLVGMMTMFGGAVAPAGYLLCDGSAVGRVLYAALFALLSTTYGAGDGATTFNVPDMRGRAPVGVGTGLGDGGAGTGLPAGTALTARARGGWFGKETHTLAASELAAHTHVVQLTALGSATGTAKGVPGATGTVASGANTPAGGAHNNLQPVMTVNFIIKT